jgi:endonuclease/exonuclease/phosphatase (EEP) superfamily protein YafD
MRRIDWILVRGLEPVRAEVVRTNASDHLPVVATLGLK